MKKKFKVIKGYLNLDLGKYSNKSVQQHFDTFIVKMKGGITNFMSKINQRVKLEKNNEKKTVIIEEYKKPYEETLK